MVREGLHYQQVSKGIVAPDEVEISVEDFEARVSLGVLEN